MLLYRSGFVAQRTAAMVASLGIVLWSQTAGAQSLTPSNLYITATNATFEGGVFTGNTVPAAFSILTNGVVNHGDGVTALQDNVDTWTHDNFGRNHFVGLQYAAANRFDTITVDLGNQFVDGGDWQATPKLYILKNPTMVGSTVRPEFLPSNIWTEVTGHVETAGHVFDPIVVPGAGTTMTFDLSAIPAAARTGWGWALGGVPGNHRASDGLWNFLSLTEASATGVAAASPIVAPTAPQPVNIVSNAYHFPIFGGDGFADNRGAAFEAVTNGVVDHGGAGPVDGFDTFEGDTVGQTDFVGLHYNTQVKFDSITIELGNQFGDGGDWEATPRIFILKNAVDTDTARPEDDPANWTEITGATETTGHIFDPFVVPGAGGTITFDLTSIGAADRTGWGWAVGGVDGNQNGTGNFNFLSITEVSATGSVAAAQAGDFDGDGDVDGADFVAWQTNFPTATGATLAQGDADGDGDVDGADFVVWQTNFPFTPGPGAAPVPEPGAGLLATLAVAAALAVGRRRR